MRNNVPQTNPLTLASAYTLVVSDDFYCRHQIIDLNSRKSRYMGAVVRRFCDTA